MKKQEKSLPCLARSRAILPTLAALAILSAYGCGGSSSDDGTDPVDQASQNCAAGTITVNDVTFSYDAFNHEETQDVASTQEGDYENTTSTDTLLCDDGSVSSQGNFSQETTENELDLNAITSYLADNGYAQIEDLDVTFRPIAQQPDSNDSYQVNAKVLDPKIFQISSLQPNQNFMVAEPTLAVQAYFTPSEEDITDLSVNSSYLSGTSNDGNITTIIETGIKRSELKSRLEELQSGKFISTRSPILGYVTGSTSVSGESVHILRIEGDIDERTDHGVPDYGVNVHLGIGPDFQVSGNVYLVDNKGNTINVEAHLDNGAIGSFNSQNGIFNLHSGLANNTEAIQRVDEGELKNGSYILAQNFIDNDGVSYQVNLGTFLKGTKIPPTAIIEKDGSISIEGLEHCINGTYNLLGGCN